MAKVPYITADQVAEGYRDLLARDVNLYRAMIHSPEGTRHFQSFANWIRFNAKLDPESPATLSKRILQGILRDKLGYKGLIISDDMEMRAISGHYGLETAIQLGIEAGLDLLCFGNNMNYDANIGEKVIGIILRLVESGKVSETRIDESFARIMQLKSKIRAADSTDGHPSGT